MGIAPPNAPFKNVKRKRRKREKLGKNIQKSEKLARMLLISKWRSSFHAPNPKSRTRLLLSTPYGVINRSCPFLNSNTAYRNGHTVFLQESLEGLKGKGDGEMSDVKKEIQSVKGLLLSRYVVNPNLMGLMGGGGVEQFPF